MLAEQFQKVLGRTPTLDEISYFNKFITNGELQAEEVGQILQSLPEAQNRQLTADTNAYDSRLQAADEQTLSRGADLAGAQATSRFAGLGRPNSSALAASVFGQTGQLAGQLADRRRSALQDFYGQGLQRNAALGAQQGGNALGRGYQERDTMRQRGWDIEDYYRQQNDYNTAKKSAGGWNFLTPEFVTNQAIRGGTAYATGGMSELGGLFGGGGGGSATTQLNNANKYGPIGGWGK